MFGGNLSPTTFEYLPNTWLHWRLGKVKIPGNGFGNGCAVYVKANLEIWLIGGNFGASKRIMIFDITTKTFRDFPSTLNAGRYAHRGALIPGNSKKILITGGVRGLSQTTSVEMIDIENGTVAEVSPLNAHRAEHGIGILSINGEERLAVFGGSKEAFVEIYNTQTAKWEIAKHIETSEEKSSFGFLTSMK